MKYREHQYLGFDPFDGDRDTDLRCQTVKMVKVRKPHICRMSDPLHDISPGEYVRYEKAIYEGNWGSYYCCTPCMDAWFKEIGIYPEGEVHGECEGEKCNRHGCIGKIVRVNDEGGCSCHISPPCGYCESPDLVCDECDEEVQ